MDRSGANDITLCAIMKNEGAYLLEWIAYYRVIGFDKFVIYSNDTTDGSTKLLDRLSDHGFIEHRHQISTSAEPPQVVAYGKAIRKCKTEWVAFFDTDEFLLLKQDRTIGEYLSRFAADVSAIGIHWRIFGSSGLLRHEPGLVIERFTGASLLGHEANEHIKTIARVAAVFKPDIHRCHLSGGRYVNSSGDECHVERGGFVSPHNSSLAQVNHYVVKSREEFDHRRRQGTASLPLNAPNRFYKNERFFRECDLNDEIDVGILHLVDRVKAEISAISAALDRRPPLLRSLERRLHYIGWTALNGRATRLGDRSQA